MAAGPVHCRDPIRPTCCLIVGDGNFSFSLAYSKLNPECIIVSTSLDAEETVLERYDGAENVSRLRSVRNVKLVHGIDATKLKDYPELSGEVFDRIIFNFPHTGGKSNIKKNRALILAFFHSASHFLDSEGEVHVTLCKGQGGTPADEPRDYGNTWKVVEMAADAGLMLTRVLPFSSTDFPGYLGTGYRSQGKPFSVDSAQTHVFTRYRSAPPDSTMRSRVSPVPLTLLRGNKLHPVADDCLPMLPAELQSYLTSPIHLIDSHPLCQITEHISAALNALGLVDSPPPLSPHCSGVSEAVVCLLAEAGCDIAETHFNINLPPSLSSMGSFEKGVTLLSFGEQLVPFLLTEMQCARENKGVLCICRTFRNCLPQVGLAGQVISHELVGVTVGSDRKEDHQSLFSALEQVVWKTVGRLQGMSPMGQCITNKMDDSPLLTNCKGIVWMPNKQQDSAARASHANFSLGFEYLKDTFPLLKYGYLKPPSGLGQEDSLPVAFTFYLDALALLSFAIPDHRLLWSSEERFSPHFKHQRCKYQPKTFVPFSIFPVRYIHDVSFWVNRAGHGEKWTSEAGFCSIVRQVCGRFVAAVHLRDSHTAEDGSTGLCYRVTYSSCDEVLSRSKAYALQQQLRLAVQDRLEVELR